MTFLAALMPFSRPEGPSNTSSYRIPVVTASISLDASIPPAPQPQCHDLPQFSCSIAFDLRFFHLSQNAVNVLPGSAQMEDERDGTVNSKKSRRRQRNGSVRNFIKCTSNRNM